MTLTDYFINNVKLQKEWASDKNAISPDELPPYTRTKVWWRCEKGHEWQAALDARVSQGRGCPVCVNQMVIPGENDIATVTPQMVKLWHPTRNGELLPTMVTPGSRKLIWWQCERGHEWQAKAYSIKAGCACPYCAGKKAIVGQTDLATTHPHLMQQWSEKNELSPTELTAGSQRKRGGSVRKATNGKQWCIVSQWKAAVAPTARASGRFPERQIWRHCVPT